MTTYRGFPSGAGPALTSFGGAFRAGVRFTVTVGGCYFNGWWWWVPAGGDAGAQLFALWAMSAGATGTLVTSASSGALTAGAWNFVPYTGAPLPLGQGMEYLACTGWTAVSGFPDTNGFYAASPTVNGPLVLYSDTGGSRPSLTGGAQGAFDTSASLVTASPPTGGSSSANFGMDVQIQNNPPAGVTSYRLFPSPVVPPGMVGDTVLAYTIGQEIRLTQGCTLDNCWWYSEPTFAAALPTKVTVWSVLSGLAVATFVPTWSGAAGAGWVSAPFPGSTTLPPGSYRVSCYCSTGGTNQWTSTVNSGDVWGAAGIWAGGVTVGPLYAPDLAHASLGWNYNASDSGSTPPYTDGTQRNAQSVFGQTVAGTEIYPQLVATGLSGSSQWYPVDLEVTPLATPASTALIVPDSDRTSRRRGLLW